MDLLPTSDQGELMASVRSYLAEEFPLARLRAPGGRSDAQRLPELAGLGWLALALPEDSGGAGGGVADEMLLFREAGRHLLSPTLLATLLAARLAALAGHQALMAELVCGSTIGAFAYPAADRLLFIDADLASLGVVWTASELRLVRRPADAAPVAGFDDSLSLLTADPASVETLVRVGADHDLASLARVLSAALLVGIGQGTRDMAGAHAQFRQQFGRPIGAFQAIKHRCADMAVGAEAAAALCSFAAVSLGDGRADGVFQSSAAKLLAARVAQANAAANIQIHGAMGFTAECDAQRYVKRTRVLDYLGGSIRDLRADVLATDGAMVGAGPPPKSARSPHPLEAEPSP